MYKAINLENLNPNFNPQCFYDNANNDFNFFIKINTTGEYLVLYQRDDLNGCNISLSDLYAFNIDVDKFILFILYIKNPKIKINQEFLDKYEKDVEIDDYFPIIKKCDFAELSKKYVLDNFRYILKDKLKNILNR